MEKIIGNRKKKRRCRVKIKREAKSMTEDKGLMALMRAHQSIRSISIKYLGTWMDSSTKVI